MTQISSVRSRILLGSFLSLAAAMPTTAFAADIVGTIADVSDTRALQGTEVRIVELGRIAESGRDGSFRFADVPAGTYTLEARYVGAEPVTRKVDVTDGGRVVVDFTLGTDGAILVIGQAANLSSSLSRQRAADGVESVLTRDAIGQFPDQNVAESLRRLPGVNILNDQGEGRFVSVRGLDPELNAASINGTRVPAPESDVRSVALDVVPAELIESIEVKKSLTPDMDADTLGASIEINTTSAFDRKKDLLSVKVEGSYNDYADALTPKGSIDFSTRITDNFGIAGGVSYYRRKFETDNIEGSDWAVNDDGNAYAEELQYRDYDVTRERIGGSLSLDFRASDSTKLYARGLYSEFSDHEYRGDLTLIMSGKPVAAMSSATSAFFRDADGRIEVRRRMKDRFEKQKIKSVTLGGETETGPWKLSYSGSWAEASELENGSVDPTRFRARFQNNGVNVDFDYSDPRRPLFEVSGNVARFEDPTRYGFNELELTDLSNARDREWTMRGDIAREFAADSGSITVQAGIKARWRDKSYDLETQVFDGYNGSYTLADVLGNQTYRIQDLGPLPSRNGPTDFFYANRSGFEPNALDTIVNSAASDYAIDEDVLAGYLLGRFDSSDLRVIGGLRVERTKNDIRGFLVNVEDEDEDPVVSATRFARDYSNWLPSLAVRYDAARNVVLRFGAYKNLVRPKLSNLAPRFTINEDREAEFGNPDLRPYDAWNMDLSAEWYFGKNSALTAGLFWKSVKDFIVTVRDRDGGSAYGVDYEEATTFQNGDTAKIKGIELSYAQQFDFLPAPFDGLLLNANYSYTDAKGTVFVNGNPADARRITLPSASKHTFNVAIGYEKGPISLRAAGTYRDKYLDELGADAAEDRIVDQHFQLDLSAKYRITKDIRLFAEWVNVTDAPYFAYQNVANSKRLLQYEKYSWTAKFGVSASF
ncbi:MAG: TonB-dependent receptor [Sphingopyxis sp.]|uniref:TonB-dependent receptor n=1 Tax=Sphingopyxis sp. TaxID=1908224 RepID=UPI002AB96C7D|nr:TonB-dependent receptor [Sphingopyxis sp.]MDZ3832403.1 TonB-dependent receptor [Sphingopyxis sp.]